MSETNIEQQINISGNPNVVNVARRDIVNNMFESNNSEDTDGECKNETGKPIKRILMLSANPLNTERLRSDNEISGSEDSILRSRYRDMFDFHIRLAIGFRGFRRALLDYNPQIVHFTGHGSKNGILVEAENGLAVPISPEALSGLFSLFTGKVECVILNACYSASQVESISEHIEYVIGMRSEIEEKAAFEFALGFYDALGGGRSVEDAFAFGRNAIMQSYPGLTEHQIPILKQRQHNG